MAHPRFPRVDPATILGQPFDPVRDRRLLGHAAARAIARRLEIQDLWALDDFDREERRREARFLGLAGMRAIRDRRRAIRRLKRAVGDLPIPEALLDQVVEPVQDRKSRRRIRRESDQ